MVNDACVLRYARSDIRGRSFIKKSTAAEGFRPIVFFQTALQQPCDGDLVDA
jgi:hypothetical protein